MDAVYVNSIQFRNERSWDLPKLQSWSVSSRLRLFYTLICPPSLSFFALFFDETDGDLALGTGLRAQSVAVARGNRPIARWPDGNVGAGPIGGKNKWGRVSDALGGSD